MNAIETLSNAQKFAFSTRPKVGGFPHLAEILKQAGVLQNLWYLPSCQSVYIMKNGNVVQQGTPLVTGLHEIPPFHQEALIKALRTDQAGQSSFPEFLDSTWKAGVIRYEVDFNARTVSYFGALGEVYIEEYPQVQIPFKDSV